MTAIPPVPRRGRGLLIGVGFFLLVLLSAWFSGVFAPFMADSSSLSAAADSANADPATAADSTANPTAAADLAAPAPVVTATVLLAGSAAAATAESPAIWHDVAARTPASTPAPLIIGLHGRGDTARNFAAVAQRMPGALAWRMVQAESRYYQGFAWFLRDDKQRPTGITESVAAIHRQITRLPPRRAVALFGFSQGCMIILHYLVAHPERVRAAVCIGGSVIGPLAAAPTAPTTPAGSGAPPRPPILFVSGARDHIVPAQATRNAITALEAQGFPTEHIEHDGGHRIPNDPRIGQWLLQKVN